MDLALSATALNQPWLWSRKLAQKTAAGKVGAMHSCDVQIVVPFGQAISGTWESSSDFPRMWS